MGDTYLFLKSLHLLGVVLFLGNIIITGWWKVMANRTKNPAIIAFAQRQVTLTDLVFTFGGVLLVLVGGLGNAWLHDMDIWGTAWLSWGVWLFIASGVIWMLILVPLQISLERMAKQFAGGGNIPDLYWKYERLWGIFGTIATILPLLNLYFMVYKIT